NTEHALLRPVDDADNTRTMTYVLIHRLLNAQQHAVAEAGRGAAARVARHDDADLRRGAVRLLVPFVRRGNEVAVAVARRDVREHGRGQGAGMMQLLVASLDGASVGEIAQHALQVRAQRVLQAEGAGDFARADLARLLTDEGEDFGLVREGRRVAFSFAHVGAVSQSAALALRAGLAAAFFGFIAALA